MVPSVLIESDRWRHVISLRRVINNQIKVVLVVDQNVVGPWPVAKIKYSRIGAAVDRLPPGGEGQASSARGEGVDVHILTLSR